MSARKNTRQRSAILEYITSVSGPVSAEDVYDALRALFPAIALSTVYRNLERFAEDGLLEKENSPDGIFRYSLREEHGHYLICTVCKRRVRLHDCPLSSMEHELAEETGFSIDSHCLTLYGTCPQCREKNGEPGRAHHCKG